MENKFGLGDRVETVGVYGPNVNQFDHVRGEIVAVEEHTEWFYTIRDEDGKNWYDFEEESLVLKS